MHAARRPSKWDLAHVVYRTAVNIWPCPPSHHLLLLPLPTANWPEGCTADIHVSKADSEETQLLSTARLQVGGKRQNKFWVGGKEEKKGSERKSVQNKNTCG